ncbi:MAG: hypothetical protein Q8R02_23360 [Hyphomonadaceae bacterium]|nr:hypothetical protein [Hyphomonadaceae bacterium]
MSKDNELAQAEDGHRGVLQRQECEMLWALADRVEREDPNPYIASAILVAAGHQTLYRGEKLGWEWRKDGKGIWSTMPRPDLSQDAADTLRPEGAEYSLSTLYGLAQVECPLNSDDCQGGARNDGNVPMALCAGFLRARAALKHAALTKAEGSNPSSPSSEAARTPPT